MHAWRLNWRGRTSRIDNIYVAPEAPDAPSRGRKPLPQFLFDARDEFHLDLAQSYFIGDKLIDLQCGWNAGREKGDSRPDRLRQGVERTERRQNSRGHRGR